MNEACAEGHAGRHCPTPSIESGFLNGLKLPLLRHVTEAILACPASLAVELAAAAQTEFATRHQEGIKSTIVNIKGKGLQLRLLWFGRSSVTDLSCPSEMESFSLGGALSQRYPLYSRLATLLPSLLTGTWLCTADVCTWQRVPDP